MSDPNFANRTVWTGDNLDILRGLNSETVDLIYLDPPFNSNQDYAAPVGSKAAGAAFKDTWHLSDLDVAWMGLIAEEQPAVASLLATTGAVHGKGMQSYLTMMAVRLLEMRRVLKDTGSIYLHCDPTASHYLKALMDAIFGRSNFRNEITWKRTSSRSDAKRFGRIHDVLLFYVNGDESTWNGAWEALDAEYVAERYSNEDSNGRWQSDQLTASGLRNGDSGQPWRSIDPATRGNHWRAPGTLPDWARARLPNGFADRLTREKLDVLDEIGMIHWPAKEGGMPRFKRYLSMSKGRAAGDVITDIPPIGAHAKERLGYPTQKPLALLERVIAASSNPGDVVLDPFCGCATACVAAEKLERRWVGIDLSPKAAELVNIRLQQEMGSLFHHGYVTARDDILRRTDIDTPKNYRQNKHVLYGQQEGRCGGCRMDFLFKLFEVDHVVPQSRGGTDHIENLQLLCSHCNRVKGDREQSYLLARLAEVGVGVAG